MEEGRSTYVVKFQQNITMKYKTDRHRSQSAKVGGLFASTCVSGHSLQKILHLPDIGAFAVQKLLGEQVNGAVGNGQLVQIFQPLYHAPGVSLDHHAGDFGFVVPAGQLEPGHTVGQKPNSRIQFRYLPTPLVGKGMGFRFDGIVFFQLIFQGGTQAGIHGGIQHAADTDLPHLGGFQDGGE